MIYIDFSGGAHGNYLEWVCNKFLAKIKTEGTPFNALGASHGKKYLEPRVFHNGHYSIDWEIHKMFAESRDTHPGKIPNNSKVISIQITYDDLLPLQSISLLRAGDWNVDPDKLEVNTYGKLHTAHYRWFLDTIIDGFFKGQLTKSYNAVKDPSWPDIATIADFKNLPDWIQQECIDMHNLTLLELNEDNPDCPRNVLREFFKIGFKNPALSGFITEQQKMVYDPSNDVKIFRYSCFYDIDQFVQEFETVASWLGYDFKPTAEFIDLHNQFLSRQPYKHSKIYCDEILERIKKKEQFDFPTLDLLQESYLTAHTELYYDIELPNNIQWFANSSEIYNILPEKS